MNCRQGENAKKTLAYTRVGAVEMEGVGAFAIYSNDEADRTG